MWSTVSRDYRGMLKIKVKRKVTGIEITRYFVRALRFPIAFLEIKPQSQEKTANTTGVKEIVCTLPYVSERVQSLTCTRLLHLFGYNSSCF